MIDSGLHIKNSKMPYFVSVLPDSIHLALNKLEVKKYPISNGRAINIYKMGNQDKDILILLLPYGVSVLVLLRLIESLSKYFNVICWESLGCPDTSIDVNKADFDMSSQSMLLKNIIKDECIDNFHLVGWCQAAQLVVYSVTKDDVSPKTISLISPAGLGCASSFSEFDRSGLPLYLEIEKGGLELATQLLSLLKGYVGEDTENGESASLSKIHLTSAECTFRFSKYMKSYVDNKEIVAGLLPDFFSQYTVLSIHSSSDNYTHVSETLELKKKYSRVEEKIYDYGGHLSVYSHPENLTQMILGYIKEKQGMYVGPVK